MNTLDVEGSIIPKRTSALEFTDAQRAEIFARDRALCAYSGRSLWLADYGAAPHAVDWVDHIKPVARGGRPTLDNGVACSHLYNFQKRAGAGGVLLFFAGRPTVDYFTFFHVVRPDVAEHLRRFASLHSSDWYFNRALFHVLLGASGLGASRKNGAPLTRSTEYRAKAAMRFLEAWAQASRGIPSLSKRGLLPRRAGADQKLLLSAAQADTVPKLKRLINALAPYSLYSWRALETLARTDSAIDALALAKVVRKHPHVARTVKEAIRRNVELLSFDDA